MTDPNFWESIQKGYDDPSKIPDIINDYFTSAQKFRLVFDPLTLDLDGDGLETTGIDPNAPILFDHNADGIKTGTGWVSADDGMLVLDRNGNGSIDTGQELFGDSTVKSNGQLALDGFDALADLDSNADGQISSADAQFAGLQIWRDLNQDGISQGGELFTLASLGIASISTAKTANSQTLANENQIAGLGTYTRTDGSTGTSGDINLAADTFHREFTDTLDTSTVSALPDMQGSGVLRDLREAASQSATLQNLLTQYSAATTREAQLALLDQMLDAWADTGGMAESLDERVATLCEGELIPSYTVRYESFGSQQRSYSGSITGGLYYGHDIDNPNLSAEFRQSISEWTQKMHILESFNGRYFFGLPGQPQDTGAVTGMTYDSTGGSGGGAVVSVPIQIRYTQAQLDLLQQSYDALKQAVYDGLLLQTRFAPVLDLISLALDETGIRLDFTQVESHFQNLIAGNAPQGIADLVEFNRASKDVLAGTGWQGYTLLENQLRSLPVTPELQAVYDEMHILKEAAGATSTSGTDKDNILVGHDGNSTLNGLAGNDIIYGGAGNDYIYGGAGNDVITGGAGNDYLSGGTGNDIYLFGKGSGQDTVYNYDTGTGKVDAIQFSADVAVSEVIISRSGDDLVLSIAGTSDKLTVQSYFYADAAGGYKVEQIQFADGTTWNADTVKILSITGNDTAQTLTGYATADTINAAGGNDIVYGRAGNDALDGGAGADTVYGGDGDDVVYGGADNDYVYGENGNDTLDGGADSDTLYGGVGSDTYLFGKGSGQDAVYNYDTGSGKTDTIQFTADVAVSEVLVSRSGDDLVLSIAGTSDKLTVQSYFYADAAGSYKVEQIQFADGTTWNADTVKILSITGNDAAQTLMGYATADAINSAGGNDIVYGRAGNDALDGGAGADTVYGGDGDDVVYGGADNDYVYGENGNDTLDGGTGSDYLYGGTGNDTYLFGKGSGQDTVNTYDAGAGKTDTIQIAADVAVSEVLVNRSGDDLILSIAGTSDSLRVQNHFCQDGASSYKVEQIQFADGTTWNADTVKILSITGNDTAQTLTGYATADTINAGGGNDYVYGRAGNDALDGGAGADTVYGGDGDDVVYGGADNDYVYGENGNDTLDGGTGNDYLYGGTGNDTYLFGKGSGQDTVNTYDAGAGKTDTIQIAADVAVSEVLVNRSGDDLILSIAGTSDSLRVQNHFCQDGASSYKVEQIQFADGTTWNADTVKILSITGNDTAQTLTGYATADTINAAGGNDIVYGRAGNDALDGGTGADYIYGGDGDDAAYGGADNDYLYGDAGSDTLDGGSGNDTLNGGAGNDTYLFGKGDGQDTISPDYDTAAGKFNVLQFKTGVAPSEIVATRSGNDLALSIAGTADKVTLGFFFYSDDPANAYNPVQQVKFADGTSWDVTALKDKFFAGTAAADSIIGTTAADTISGQAGTDYLYGRDGSDVLDGGADNDILYGDAGADTLFGGTGNDTLIGGAGSDTYLFGRGSGADFISDYDPTAGNTDVLFIGSDVAADQLWFRRVGSDLEVSIIGSTDKSTISNWYAGSSYHVEQFITSDGKMLLDSQVDALVSAMAAFAPPAAGETTLPPAYQTSLVPVIAANWQ